MVYFYDQTFILDALYSTLALKCRGNVSLLVIVASFMLLYCVVIYAKDLKVSTKIFLKDTDVIITGGSKFIVIAIKRLSLLVIL